MVKPEPEIFGLHATNFVKRYYSLSYTEVSKSENPEMDEEHKLKANIYRFLRGEYMMTNGSTKAFVGNGTDPLFFALTLSTKLDFAESVEFFKKILASTQRRNSRCTSCFEYENKSK